VFSEAYERLVNTVETSRTTIIDSYGATSPVEYFAVVVELFFEKPVALKREEPAVYVQLSKFFELDPAGWK
jgi:Mlc titration factor MtfA (ptsG expression regulator)